ncbi:MAG TPA: sigma-70 family RNA polymerase sigma factor [Saprospiraceae bacterium]|nr:sigma-70 family RNA polymerase sigma factor [Saprospiraceae bacterium]HMQ83077.1 sigma-70 family RNA polymerase sigma factor [Saprospiraceae bacterium]
MKKGRLIDDAALFQGIQMSKDARAFDVTWQHYRAAFIDFFVQHLDYEPLKAGALYDRTVFPVFFDQIKSRVIRLPLSLQFFGLLLALGLELEGNKRQHVERLRQRGHQYIEANLLLTMIGQEVPGFLSAIDQQFKPQATLFLATQYPIQETDGHQICNKALESLHRNVQNGTLMPPMKSTLFTYFTSVVKNLSRNFLRSHEKEVSLDPEDMRQYDVEPIEEASIFEVIWQQLKESVRLYQFNDREDLLTYLLEQLNGKQVEVVKLFYLENYSHKEIAEKLDISEAASRKRLYDGMEVMREVLKRVMK